MEIIAVAALAAFILATGQAGGAQRVSDVAQIDKGESRPIDQIAAPSNEIIAPSRAEARSAAPASQLSSGAESRRAAPQLTGESRTARSGPQLYDGGRTAQPSEPLSRPSEGRTGAIAKVDGEDRCDPQRSADRALDCTGVIETRSAEFKRPAPAQLSPEERLLVEQRLRERPAGARGAARRLAEQGEDAGSLESQGVASVVLRNAAPAQREPQPRDETQGLSQEAAAVVNAILGPQGGSMPPQR
jgi:hypothetical protein